MRFEQSELLEASCSSGWPDEDQVLRVSNLLNFKQGAAVGDGAAEAQIFILVTGKTAER